MQGIPEGQTPSEHADLSADGERNCGGEAEEHLEGFISDTHDPQADQSLPAPTQSQSRDESLPPGVSTYNPSLQEHYLIFDTVDVRLGHVAHAR